MAAFMNTPQVIAPNPQGITLPKDDFTSEPLVTAKQASVALNMPLYYLINTQKRDTLGVPYYSINKMVRFRIGELHKWRVAYLALKSEKSSADPVGGVDA
jgi:hypothetical protein